MKKLILMTALLGTTLGINAQPATTLPSPVQPTLPVDNHENVPTHADDFGHKNFTDADTNNDGVLSLSEAQAALPRLIVEDSNADGLVNQFEAEMALPELKFMERGREGGEAPITETEFGMIVVALNEREDETGSTGPLP